MVNGIIMKLVSGLYKLCVFLGLSALTLLLLKQEGVPFDRELLLAARLKGPLPYDDPYLLQLVAQEYLHPPASLPYHLVEDQFNSSIEAVYYYSFVTEHAYKFYAPIILELLEDAPPGFFVEAGALDGEFLSNTLPLERHKGWTGLLVEADIDMFNKLLKKRRRAWASHSCLSTRGHPHGDTLVKYEFQGKSRDILLEKLAKAHASLIGSTNGSTVDGSTQGREIYESVQCLPLATLLLAINVTHVDLVSLDVEGAEVGVLQHFPWDRIKVDSWLVEHATPSTQRTSAVTREKQDSSKTSSSSRNDVRKDANKAGAAEQRLDQEFIDMFIKQGYHLYRATRYMHIPNYVFVLRGSSTYKRLVAKGHIEESSAQNTRRSDLMT